MNERAARKLWKQSIKHLTKNEPESLDWARSTGTETFKSLRKSEFLTQYCFVVYASGFRYKTVKACFPELKTAFADFKLQKLAKMDSVDHVLPIFGNERKAKGFLAGAKQIAAEGWKPFKARLKQCGKDVLKELPGIADVTKDHLAKNIGLVDTAKPDVWLVRAAQSCGAQNVTELVEFLHEDTGETRHVIDVAIWTFARDGMLAKAE